MNFLAFMYLSICQKTQDRPRRHNWLLWEKMSCTIVLPLVRQYVKIALEAARSNEGEKGSTDSKSLLLFSAQECHGMLQLGCGRLFGLRFLLGGG